MLIRRELNRAGCTYRRDLSRGLPDEDEVCHSDAMSQVPDSTRIL